MWQKNFLNLRRNFEEEKFMLSMLIMLDDWEKQEGIKFEKIMPSDSDMILKAIKVLNVEPSYVHK